MTQHYKGKRQSQARGFGDSHTLMCAMMPDGQVRTIESSRPDSELSAWIRQARQDGSVSIYCESLEHVGVDVPELSASDHLKAFNDLPWPDLVKCTQRTFPGCGCGGYHAAGSEVSE